MRATFGVRGRLTAIAVLAVLLPVLVATLGLVLALHRTMSASLTTRAENQARDVAAVLAQDGLGSVERGASDFVDEGGRVQVLDGSGSVVFASTRSAQRPLTDLRPGLDSTQTSGGDAIPWPGRAIAPLIAARGVEAGGQRYTVVVAINQGPERDAVTTFGKAMLVGGPLVLAGTAVAAWLLVGRTLRPVEQIRRDAEVITTGHLDARVSVPGGDDEITRLALTMNDMLGRLEAGQQAQRRFVADASHELRSPLASLSMAVELADSPGGDVTWDEVAPVVGRETERLRQLVDDLLTLSKVDDAGRLPLARRVEVDLDEVVGAEVRRLTLTTDLDVRQDIAAARVLGDEHQLVRVVRNLTDNAARHAKSALALSVDAPVDGLIRVRVEDDGPGIAAEDRERVFERFLRLDSERSRHDGGSGLGLAIVAEVVRAHHGSVAVDNSPLGGARFTVSLPVTG
ncbi:MAG: HAMP domain-containing histidine kinase [Actinobacteria bacterium]|nr:HAMP domain-containing histidine kinase [Actinomycetota bacterium]